MKKEKQKKTRGKTRRWNLNYDYINTPLDNNNGNQKDKKQDGELGKTQYKVHSHEQPNAELGLSASPSDKELNNRRLKSLAGMNPYSESFDNVDTICASDVDKEKHHNEDMDNKGFCKICMKEGKEKAIKEIGKIINEWWEKTMQISSTSTRLERLKQQLQKLKLQERN